MNDIAAIAKQLVRSGTGILAADESNPSANKRFAPLGIEETEEKRRQYRQLLLTTEGIEEYLSGVILYDETIRQATDEGKPLVDVVQEKGIIPGIKVDLGLKELPGFPGEKVSQGLDNLDERLEEYARMGAKFTKWRSVIAIGDGVPTTECIAANVHVLARYAGIVQATGMVPIVEPEVLLDGDHTLEDCWDVLTRTLEALFEQLHMYRVDLSGLILKTSMVLPGKDSSETATHQQIAQATSEVLRGCVPADVAGVVFLSGGQAAEDAIIRLNAIAALGPYDWGVTFSYARALQGPVLKHWAGNPANVASAQTIFLDQIKKAATAQTGQYQSEGAVDDYAANSQDI